MHPSSRMVAQRPFVPNVQAQWADSSTRMQERKGNAGCLDIPLPFARLRTVVNRKVQPSHFARSPSQGRAQVSAHADLAQGGERLVSGVAVEPQNAARSGTRRTRENAAFCVGLRWRFLWDGDRSGGHIAADPESDR